MSQMYRNNNQITVTLLGGIGLGRQKPVSLVTQNVYSWATEHNFSKRPWNTGI